MSDAIRTIKHTEADRIRKLFVGRTVDSVSLEDGTITLDDGTVLVIQGNMGCGGCISGEYNLVALNDFNNRIMRAKVVSDKDLKVFELFVYGAGPKPKAHSLARIVGDEGNGYYGVGFTIRVMAE